MNSLKVQSDNHKNSESWTDDLPVCKDTGIGFSTNQIYREDGHPQEEHAYEDFSSHFAFSNKFFWYAVYDGHKGKRAADFCSQRMTAEIYFSEISEKKTDEEIREQLRQAMLTVEAGYMQTLDESLAARTSLQSDITEGLTTYEAYQKMNQLDCELASGTALAVALIIDKKLYVANVGNCRVLLCQTDPNYVLKVVQLSIDHDLKNEDELLRLSQIGINPNTFRHNPRLGNQDNTRCLGNYAVKGGYKDFPDLATATQAPVIAEPDIHGGIVLDDSCRFLLLMTSGLYRSVEEALGPEQVNQFIAQSVVEQFRKQATLTGVAQAVVDKVVRLHHDWYMSNSLDSPCTPKREDITLVLRNFNFPMPNALKSPTKGSSQIVGVEPLIKDGDNTLESTVVNTILSTKTNSTSSSEAAKTETGDYLGRDQRIPAYVDFEDFYRNFESAKKNGTLPTCLDG